MTVPARETVRPSARALRSMLRAWDKGTQGWPPVAFDANNRGKLLARIWIAEIRERVAAK